MKNKKMEPLSQKVMKKVIQVTVGSTLLEWPPICLTFDYQPYRPNKVLPKPRNEK